MTRTPHTSAPALALVVLLAACARDQVPHPAVATDDAGLAADATAEVGPDAADADGADDPWGCRDYCDRLVECLTPLCTADRATALFPTASCVAECAASASFHDVLPTLLAYSCLEIQQLACGQLDAVAAECDCAAVAANATDVGAACQTDADCDGGRLTARCLPEVDPMGGRTGFVDGYCVVDGCQSSADCGDGGVCVRFQGSVQCLAGCADDAACRSGYACWPVDVGDGGICFPACGGEVVCNDPDAVCVRGVCGEPPPCTSGNDCPFHLQCDEASAVCRPIMCAMTPDCPAGFVCANGICN